jgi:hypothetical protein
MMMTQSEQAHPTTNGHAHPLARLDEADIAAARQRHSLVDLLERHGIPVTGSGPRHTARCPFHDDQSPSLSVYLDSNRYYCFACGARGDTIALVQQLEGLNFREAVARLNATSEPSPSVAAADVAPATGALPAGTQASLFAASAHEVTPIIHAPTAPQALDLLTVAAALYQAALATSAEARAYLRARGIKGETAQRMHVGYGRPGALRDFLGDNPALAERARQIGLLDTFGKERMEGRIIIPEIRDGRCLWMVGRTLLHHNADSALTNQEHLQPSSPSGDGPKYLGVTAPKPLMGIGAMRCDQPPPHRIAAQSAQPAQAWATSGASGIIVVEGPFDLLAAQQWRLPVPCVALVGAHPSRQQLTELITLAAGRPIWLALDADVPGDAGAERLRATLVAAHYTNPLYRLRPPLSAKDFGEIAGVSAARTMVLRELTYPLESTSASPAASEQSEQANLQRHVHAGRVTTGRVSRKRAVEATP